MARQANDVPKSRKFEEDLAPLLAGAGEQPPSEVFGGVSDEFWLWINTEGYRRSAASRAFLPGLPQEDVQRRFTNKSNDDALVEAFEIYRLVRDLFERHVGALAEAEGVLDFGCGWGRVIRFFLKDLEHDRLTGAEYDGELVDFCKASNPWCTFIHSEAEPPLPFGDAQFSCIYAYSVFSHFSESMHLAWLRELKRVLRPGGALMLSIRPRSFIEYLGMIRAQEQEVEFPVLLGMFPETEEELARYDAGEYCYTPYDPSRPDAWWGEACIPPAYIEREWGRFFEVEEIVEASEQIKQHVVMLRA
jgi:SAM-dependent methyltransferase